VKTSEITRETRLCKRSKARVGLPKAPREGHWTAVARCPMPRTLLAAGALNDEPIIAAVSGAPWTNVHELYHIAAHDVRTTHCWLPVVGMAAAIIDNALVVTGAWIRQQRLRGVNSDFLSQSR
jgi:hypothetical protein